LNSHTCTNVGCASNSNHNILPLPLLKVEIGLGAASAVLIKDVEECCDNDSVVGAVVTAAEVAVSCGGASGSRTVMQSMRSTYVNVRLQLMHCNVHYMHVHKMFKPLCTYK